MVNRPLRGGLAFSRGARSRTNPNSRGKPRPYRLTRDRLMKANLAAVGPPPASIRTGTLWRPYRTFEA